MRWLVLAALAACSSHDGSWTSTRPKLQPPALDASLPPDAPPPPVDAAPPTETGEVWLKGATHVHTAPSGDSSEPTENVVAWYDRHGYDFLFVTDHNRVTELGASTLGYATIRVPGEGTHGPIVFAGSELTHNPSGCLPPGDETNRCRIHVNALGVTERPVGKIEWALPHHDKQRVDMYQSAFDTARKLKAALIQVNHPNYYWGMTADVLIELQKRGAQLVEIANSQFEKKWNPGDATHPSTEALWDAVLATGATMWGVASDDAHDYNANGGGKYPPGGGWIMVHARREPHAILDAIAAGRFYASTGVTLARAEVDGEELVVEVAPGDGHSQYTITFIENGTPVATSTGLTARRLLPRTGYVRAVITRDDGKKAWVQPARR